ncbi:MAG: metallophosphoesterase [Actinomycetota bacterium]|nr:metallophosphoesterase [Actinomycetota bacterium]
MTTWFTADLHLGHSNIIGYCNRPFADVAAMNDEIVRRWNDVVAEEDTVWVLGDVALGPIDRTLALVDGLVGRKVLVAGNHDRCWAGNGPRAHAWTERYLDAGFAEVHQGDVAIDIDGIDMAVAACHFPYRGDSHDEDRYLDHRPVDRGAWLLHGHVHDRWRQRDRMINVGVDVWEFRPVSATVIGDLIATGPPPDPQSCR